LREHIKRFGDYHIDIQQTPSQIAVTSKLLEFVGWSHKFVLEMSVFT